MSFPEKIDSIVSSYLSNRGYLSIFLEYTIISHWKDIVGDDIYAISNCVGIENNILYVEIKSSSWRQEICFLKNDILSKIKSLYQSTSINDIVFI